MYMTVKTHTVSLYPVSTAYERTCYMPVGFLLALSTLVPPPGFINSTGALGHIHWLIAAFFFFSPCGWFVSVFLCMWLGMAELSSLRLMHKRLLTDAI